MYILAKFACNEIPNEIITLVGNIVTIIKIGVPVLLIVFGMVDLAKGITSQKEDEIKKGQQLFIKRLISAALVFLVVAIVQLVMNFVDVDNTTWSCAKSLINGQTH